MAFASNPFVTSTGVPTTARWFVQTQNVKENFYLKDQIQTIVLYTV
jgi:hypothetical protein